MARWVRARRGEWINLDRYDLVMVGGVPTGGWDVEAHRDGGYEVLFHADTYDEAQAWLDRLMGSGQGDSDGDTATEVQIRSIDLSWPVREKPGQ